MDGWTDGHPGEHDCVGLAQAHSNYHENLIDFRNLLGECRALQGSPDKLTYCMPESFPIPGGAAKLKLGVGPEM